MTDNKSAAAICVVACYDYYTDARTKNHVRALLDAGFQVDVFALGRPEPDQPGLRVSTLMSKVVSRHGLPYLLSQLRFLLVALLRIALASARHRYCIVHVHNMPDFIVFSALVPKLLGARVVLDVRDTMPEAFATKFNLDLDHPLIRLIRLQERVSAAFSDQVITTNDLHRAALIDHGIPAAKIAIMMNVGHPAVFSTRPARATRAGLVLGYHGTVTERLGLDLVIEAIHRARPTCPGLRFLLLGDGEFMSTVRSRIVAYHLEEVVVCRGWVPVERLPDELADVDIGVVGNRLSTERHRNWMLPHKMLEYAALGIPTIAPRLSVISHYFDASNSVLYTPDDAADMARAIADIYHHPERLQELRRGLAEFNARHNWPDTQRRYLGLLADLMAPRPGLPSFMRRQ
jgi:glycosyltransferase involved in cell wall biosynthesis